MFDSQSLTLVANGSRSLKLGLREAIRNRSLGCSSVRHGQWRGAALWGTGLGRGAALWGTGNDGVQLCEEPRGRGQLGPDEECAPGSLCALWVLQQGLLTSLDCEPPKLGVKTNLPFKKQWNYWVKEQAPFERFEICQTATVILHPLSFYQQACFIISSKPGMILYHFTYEQYCPHFPNWNTTLIVK